MSTIQSSSEHLTLNADGTAKEIKLQANGVEKAKVTSTGIDVTGRITTDGITEDTSGNVGIGTSSPASDLTVAGGADSTIRNTASSGSSWFVGSNSSGYILHNESNTPMTFTTNGTERMRIDSSGNLLVGTTSPIAGAKLNIQIVDMGIAVKALINGNWAAGFYNTSGGNVGQIVINASSTSYNTSSDYRLKTDVQPMTGATERLKALKPVNFEWISSGERVDGFLAHEAAEVVPEAVTGTKDAMRTEEYEVEPAVEATYDEDGNELTPAVEAVMGEREVPDYQGIDQSKLVPLLTSALQEAVAKIEALEARIETLEAN